MKAIAPDLFIERLYQHYTAEKCHLHWDKKRPWTLLFSVILSAQCTDKRVNKVTPILFKEFPDLESYVAKPIDREKLLEEIVNIYKKGKNYERSSN